MRKRKQTKKAVLTIQNFENITKQVFLILLEIILPNAYTLLNRILHIHNKFIEDYQILNNIT